MRIFSSWTWMPAFFTTIENTQTNPLQIYFIIITLMLFPEHLKDNLKVTSLKGTKHIHSKQPSASTVLCANESGQNKLIHVAVPCHRMVGGARSSQEILAMQPSDMDKKREAFLEYLKQKYPLSASVIIGHQERLQQQVSARTCRPPYTIFLR